MKGSTKLRNPLSSMLSDYIKNNRLRLKLLSVCLVAIMAGIPLLLNSIPKADAASQLRASGFSQIDESNKLRISSEPGVATRSSMINFADLAQQESVIAHPKSSQAVPQFMPMSHSLPLPSRATATKTANVGSNIENRPIAPPESSSSFLAVDGHSMPPGTHGAVGPNHLMIALNGQIRIQSKTGSLIGTVSLDSFWAGLGNPSAFNPKVLYDPYNHRWMITACANPRSADSSVLIGVTQSDDPTGNWNLYRINADAASQLWADSPSIGFNKDWIVVQVNMFDITSPGKFNRSHIYVFSRADLYAGGAGLFTLISASGIGGSQSPAITYDNSISTLYMVQNFNGNFDGQGFLALYTITGEVGHEVLTQVGFPTIPNPWAFSSKRFADFAPQLGSTDKIQNNEARIQNAVYRNGSLWCAQTVFLPAGNDPTHSAIQWWELSSEGAVKQQGRIEDPAGNNYYAFPSIAVNKNNDVLIGYSSFSARQYASANYSFRAATDPLNTLRGSVVLKTGEAPYFKINGEQRNRWGDYSSTMVDPIDDISMWTVQTYAARSLGGVSCWGSWWGSIKPDAAPTITGFSPTGGPVGTSITITGAGFTGTTAVSFNGTRATNFNVVSDTQITTTVPMGATSGPISVTTPNGTATSATNFIVGPAPTIIGFSPTSGPVGTSVTITGTAFSGATAVSFNNKSATNFRVVSDTQITATVPMGATSGPIIVTTLTGTATSASSFTVSAPTISGFSPTSGPVGSTVTIFGTNFTGATAVSFNGTNATNFNVVSNTQITATVPAGATSGPISVTTSGGVATSTGIFKVATAPTISGFLPTSGPAGTVVTIFGTNFTGATAVSFNGTNATNFRVVSDTQITATVPAGATTGPVSITTPSGTATSTAIFTVPATPTISGFSPTSGAIGTSVSIFGTNFTGTAAVRFNGINANFTVTSPTQITATVPAGATTGPVSVITLGGTVTSKNNFTVVLAPIISGFSPTSGPAGANVVIFGVNFTSTTAVKFNGASANTFKVLSDTQINATVPAGASTGPISVTTPGGTVTSTTNFIVPAPTITSFSPISGPVGTAVTITGTGFSGATAVSFNGTKATIFNVLSSTQITATVPASATTGPISVIAPNGTVTSTANFTIIPTPTITGFLPTSGPVGTSVTITGTNFTGTTAVKFNGASANTFNVLSDTQIMATVPAGATSGPISVTTPNGMVTSASSFNVETPDFTISINPPQLTVSRRQSGQIVVNINRSSGFIGNVTVIAPDTKRLKIKLTPPMQSTTGMSVSFDFKIKKRALLGAQQLTFTAQDDSGRVRTTTLKLVIRK